MADLVIRGMEMPLECNWKTIRLYPNGTCAFQNVEGDYNVIPYAAIQLPAEHGRLIDADALDRAFTDLRFNSDRTLNHWGDRPGWCMHGYEVEKLIADAPTIVPAEGVTDDG